MVDSDQQVDNKELSLFRVWAHMACGASASGASRECSASFLFHAACFFGGLSFVFGVLAFPFDCFQPVTSNIKEAVHRGHHGLRVMAYGLRFGI